MRVPLLDHRIIDYVFNIQKKFFFGKNFSENKKTLKFIFKDLLSSKI